MPDFHRLNKSKTTEMSREELNRRLKEEVGKSAAKQSSKTGSQKKQTQSKKQQKILEQTKYQMPPRSPERKRREEENKKREKEEKKAKKRRKRGNFVIYYIMLAIVAFIIFAILSVTVLFNAEGIVVEGETVYSDEEIIAASRLKGDENLIRMTTFGIDKRILKELVSLDSAVVTKEFFPPHIKITVTPAEPMVNFYYAGKNYVISHVGRVMQIESSAADCMEVIGYQPGDNVVIGDYITAANPEQDDMVREINSCIELAEIEGITKLDISDSLNIILTYEDRVVIYLGSILQLEEKLTIVKELVTNHITPTEKVSLNVSNPERVVQRPLTPLVTSVVTTTTTTAPEEVPEDGETTAAPEE
ncbi:MAG: FtsQ-type POTRA domain-containing protein [Ruminiclostridium sp.]|nr:FtsQ-type POTRA domain-containing protein [Ruminiclostridium sp.]